MKILVTGGAGFIGSNFVRYFLEKHGDCELVNLDALTYCGNLENLRDVESNKNYRFVKGDICDANVVEKCMEGVEYVVNFAAESHVDRSIEDPGIFVRSNVIGTQTLLDSARKHNVKKFLQISTDEVYGSLGPTGYFSETTELAPNSPYSASKAAADLMVRAYHHTFGMHVNVTRCSNNYGPYQFPEKLIPLMITNAMQDKPLPVYGDGKNVRDWLFVKDHCSAIDVVLQKGKSGEIYNIGGNNERQNIEIVMMILKHLGKPEKLIKFVKDRPGHDRRYAIDSSKIKRDLGWAPAFKFDDAMKMTVEWYVENKAWWTNIKSGEYLKYYDRMYSARLGSGSA